MPDLPDCAPLPGLLLPWYAAHRRDLPWRRNRDPYSVWLSEILLQQTRVEAVRERYPAFLRAFPSVEALADAREDALFKLWEGMGYYSRARNLLRTARIVAAEYGGVFPREESRLRALPGVGAYTAGAICSICFGQPTPAVDGNVLRVTARYFGISADVTLPAERLRITEALRAAYPPEACGDFTQSLMELGAMACLPNGTPDCAACPLREGCASRDGLWRSLPRRPEKKPRRLEERTVFVLCCGDRLAVSKRPSQGLLAGLWELPNLPETLSEAQVLAAADGWGCGGCRLTRAAKRRHIFTHLVWELTAYRLECASMPEPFRWVSPAELQNEISLPTAFRQFRELWESPGQG